MEKLLTPEEVADLLQVPVQTLSYWRYTGTGPRFVRVGRHVRYDEGAVRRWLDGHVSRPAAS